MLFDAVWYNDSVISEAGAALGRSLLPLGFAKIKKFKWYLEETMKSKVVSVFLAIVMLLSFVVLPACALDVEQPMEEARSIPDRAQTDLSEETIRSKMLALKSSYPEGMKFNNDTPFNSSNPYQAKGQLIDSISYTAKGCAAFALLLTDAAFGDLPFFELRSFTFEELRVGDVLRLNNNTHSVVILEKKANSVILAEGNYNNAVHWGRELSRSEVMAATYAWTRYPDVLSRHAAKLERDTKTFGTAQNKVWDMSKFYQFTANEDAWSALISVKNPEAQVYCIVYSDEGRKIDFFSVNSKEDKWYKDLPACEKDKNVYLMFYAYSGESKYSIFLSNADPDNLPTGFVDVYEGQYFVDPVQWAVENMITSGTDQYRFSPNTKCTRAQVVTFLWRAKGSPDPETSENPFSDVKEGEYYYSAVLWAVENKITSGTSKTAFSPNASCTRAQVVTFLWRSEGEPEPSETSNPFKDVKEGEYYYNAVLWAVENEITSGTSATAFSPNASCTRAQVVTFLYRAAHKKTDEE